jgi:hypothetical protein
MKTKKYWLKGGVLGIILLPIFIGVNSLFTGIGFMLYFSDMNGYFHVEYIIPPIILFFIIGVVGGLVYGKIKNRNKVS